MSKQKPNLPEKKGLHSRNKHKNGYDFPQLIKSCPELAPYLFVNVYETQTLDFANPEAVKMLNRALLLHFYALSYWDIPPHYLCPPIPSRADYLHHIADLLAEENKGIVPTGANIRVLDVGIGANCVYPVVGHKEYGWTFVGSDIDKKALASAELIIQKNGLEKTIECRLQSTPSAIFKDIILAEETFDLVVCNPPFHASMADFSAAANRKWQNLGKQKARVSKPIQNFGGINSELTCEGGESAFVRKMVQQSANIPTKCVWFSSLVSKSANLPDIYNALEKVKVVEVRTIEMAQGQKTSRIVAWTFLEKTQRVNPSGNLAI